MLNLCYNISINFKGGSLKMASLNTQLPVNCDSQTLEDWSNLFPSLQILLENRVKAIAKKYPGKHIDIRFSGDIQGITSADVESRTARVTAIPLTDSKQTLKSMFFMFLRKLTRSKGHSKPCTERIQPIIVCTVVMVAPTETSEASDAG
jgi:hypothetical protein